MKLAVFAFDLGASFIDKHLTELAPGNTVAIGAYGGDKQLAQLWPVKCPILEIDRGSQQIVYRLARRLGFSIDNMIEKKIARFLKAEKINVVLGEYLDDFLPYARLLNKLRIPYIVQGHGIDVSAALLRPGVAEECCAVYQSAGMVLTRSEFHRQRLIKLGLSPERVAVNIGGVQVPDKLQTRPREAGNRFLAVGRMIPKKAPFFLLEAFRKALATSPHLRLDYIGTGPFFESVQEYVRASRLENSVTLHGITSEDVKHRLLSECGVFVQHSVTGKNGDEEGLPAAIQEAMAAGMAVVSTRHTGIGEAVIEGVTGLLVDEGDVEGMSEAFLKVPSCAANFGAAGYQEAVSKHAWHYERDRLQHWLSSVLRTSQGV